MVKEIFRNSELLEFVDSIAMNDAQLTFVSPYFQFCLRIQAVMAARFS